MVSHNMPQSQHIHHQNLWNDYFCHLLWVSTKQTGIGLTWMHLWR